MANMGSEQSNTESGSLTLNRMKDQNNKSPSYLQTVIAVLSESGQDKFQFIMLDFLATNGSGLMHQHEEPVCLESGDGSLN